MEESEVCLIKIVVQPRAIFQLSHFGSHEFHREASHRYGWDWPRKTVKTFGANSSTRLSLDQFIESQGGGNSSVRAVGNT